MISPVSRVTASLIFAGTTANVPSPATLTAPASSSVFSCSATPLPCASFVPKRMERKAEARNVTYIVRLSDLSSTPFSPQPLQREQARDVRLRLFERAAGFLHRLAHGRS